MSSSEPKPSWTKLKNVVKFCQIFVVSPSRYMRPIAAFFVSWSACPGWAGATRVLVNFNTNTHCDDWRNLPNNWHHTARDFLQVRNLGGTTPSNSVSMFWVWMLNWRKWKEHSFKLLKWQLFSMCWEMMFYNNDCSNKFCLKEQFSGIVGGQNLKFGNLTPL